MKKIQLFSFASAQPHLPLRFLPLFLVFTGLLFSSCDKTDEGFAVDYKYAYYPTNLGHYVIYDVDSIIFDDFTQTSDTFTYQKMHVVDSAFTDGSGRDAHKIIRYHRADSTQSWILTDVWSAVVTQNSLEVTEENQRFVKLLFPPRDAQTWDGNKYIDSVDANWWFWKPSEWEYATDAVDASATINGMQFDSTVTVMQQADSTLIEKVVSVERYAKHVGMVYKHFSVMEKNGDITRPWTNPESGFILTMRVHSYGE